MAQSLRVLIIEDNPYDAELLEYELVRAGFQPQVMVAKTESDFLALLHTGLDVILADYMLPQFGALRALALLRERKMDIPFIVVSGAISEEVAIETIREGADDYLIKDRLARLGPAVRRALKEKVLRWERQQAYHALKRSEALNRAVLRSLAAHVAVLDAGGNIIMVNEPWASFSANKDESHFLAAVIGTNYKEACGRALEAGHEAAQRALLGIEAVLGGAQPLFSMEYPWYAPGQKQWFLMQVTPLEEQQGGVVVLHENITKLKLADEALRESEGRWRSLVASHPETIIIINADSEITYTNKAGAQIFGAVSAEQLLGQSLYRFIAPDLHEVLRKRLSTVMQGNATAPVLYKLLQLDGQERDVEAFSVPIYYNGERAAQTVFRDVTERQRYEEGLIQAKEQAESIARLRSTILTNMSHEIRTPLTTILGFAEVLADEVGGEHQMIVRMIQEGGRRLSRTLNSVLDLARLESGSLVLRLERIDVIAEVTELVSLFIPLAEDKNLRLTVTPPQEPTWADLDAAVLSRIINNLIENALKFTNEGEINVTVRADAEFIYLHVKDTGIGIDAAFLPDLFEEFKQESTGLARSFEGSGLGLTITKRLVHLAGGTIRVDSIKGVGSAFIVSLPRFATGIQAHTPPRTTRHGGSPDPRAQVLVVEDNEETQVLIDCMLGTSCTTDFAADGATALSLAAEHAYDVVLMDINLAGDLNGVAVLHLIRSDSTLQHLPVVAVTAYALPGDREQFLREGFDGYLSKPFTRKQLLETIAGVVAQV